MVATQIEPWRAGKKRKAITSTKLLFFDVGVVNALLEIDGYNPRSNDAGWQLEQFIGQELLAYCDYSDRNIKLKFWRSTDKCEVDYILGDAVAIEVKHTSSVTEKDLKGLTAIHAEGKWRHKIVVSRDPIPRRIGDIDILPVEEFLQRLWNNDLNL
jgi:predicted AAA+ superfamily ATPase